MRSLYIFLFACFFLFPHVMYSQNRQPASGEGIKRTVTITGTIIDSETLLPVEYSTISIHKSKDSSLVTGTVTDIDGKFRIEKIIQGEYYIQVNFIGYTKKMIPGVNISPKMKGKDLGKIYISPAMHNLSEIDVTAKKEMVEFSLDKKVINVEKNIASIGGSAIEVLQNIPSVTVDIDGTLSMRGNSNVTVLVDGKPSGLSGLSNSSILEQIPASSIEKIEVITNPSAKYDPDGMSGIINIILKKKRDKGYNGMVSVTAGTGDRYNGSVNLNFRREKLNLFGSYDWRKNKRPGSSHYQRQEFLNDTLTFTNTDENSNGTRTSGNIKGGFDYSFNDFNLVTFSVLANLRNDNDNEFGLSTISDSVMVPTSFYDIDNSEQGDDHSVDYSLSYLKKFEKKGEELTVDAIYSSALGKEHNYVTTRYYDSLHFPVSDFPQKRHTITGETSDVFTLQSDYTNPLSGKSRIEAGFKSIIRAIDNDYRCDSFVYDVLNDWQYDSLQSNHFVYNEQIHSIYGIFSSAFDKLEYQAGLRFEQTFTRSEQKDSGKDFPNDYFNVFPTLHISYKLINDNAFQISYSRRINRPASHQLNPFVDKSMVSVYHFGNPELTPEYVNAYEIGFLKYWNKTSLNTSVFYKYVNDIIQRYIYFVQVNDTTSIQYATSKNMSKGISYGLEFVLQHDLFKWWNINLNYSYFRNKIEGTADSTSLTNSNYTWTARLNSNMTIWKSLDIQLIGNYRAPMVNIQGTMDASYNVDIAMKKDFYKGNLSLSLRASDIFNTQQFNMHRSGDGFIIDMKHKRESRIVYLGLTYKINGGIKQKENKRPEAEKQEEMDF